MIRTAFFASLTLLALAALACFSPLFAAEAASPSAGESYVPPLWTLLPFLGILLSIAVVPLISHAFWEKRYPQISALWLVLGLTAMLISTVLDPNWSWSQAYGGQLFRSYEEYFSFIVLLGSLFVISGGLYVGGNLRGTVWTNTIILTVGSLLASLIGTTGAAMVLIRPLLRANEQRRYRAHTVVFFIFLVCNIGGALTPIGDPPLFLGFLQGIPFTWTLNLTPLWAFSVIIVLLIYFVLDSILVRREAPRALQPARQNIRRDAKSRALHLEGSYNLLLLLGVVAAGRGQRLDPLRDHLPRRKPGRAAPRKPAARWHPDRPRVALVVCHAAPSAHSQRLPLRAHPRGGHLVCGHLYLRRPGPALAECPRRQPRTG